MTARLSPAAPNRARAKPAPSHRGLIYLSIGVCLAIAASATTFALWPKAAPAPVVAAKEQAPPQKPSGHVIISRENSQLCDRYLFDNVSGKMKPVDTVPCNSTSKRPEVNIADQVNSFQSSWRGARERELSAPRGGKTP